MMLLIGTIIVLIIGIILAIIGSRNWDYEDLLYLGVILIIIFGLILLAEITILLSKSLKYKEFKIEYDTIKETMTSKDDIRDATFTNNMIEINKEIRSCNEYKDSIWFNIFQNEKICETEIIKKGE